MTVHPQSLKLPTEDEGKGRLGTHKKHRLERSLLFPTYSSSKAGAQFFQAREGFMSKVKLAGSGRGFRLENRRRHLTVWCIAVVRATF
jgi:hypothetical protein